MKWSTYVLKKAQEFKNTEAPSHYEWGHTDSFQLPAGSLVSVWTQKMTDGRVYFTFFVMRNGKFYCNTLMRQGFHVSLNTGGIRASEDLLRFYKTGKLPKTKVIVVKGV